MKVGQNFEVVLSFLSVIVFRNYFINLICNIVITIVCYIKEMKILKAFYNF